jgi:alkylation response protein AidB-like acyl-CoA dehydrogenase
MHPPRHDEMAAAEAELAPLTTRLAELDGPADDSGAWPEPLWTTLVAAGAVRWSLPADLGREGCDRAALLTRYAHVARGSLTAAFILSQHDAAVRRLLAARDRPVAQRWLEAIAAGQAFATVGISQLTTSRRLGPQPVRATGIGGGRFQVDGVIPWVTAAARASVLVAGAASDDGQQLLFALPTDRPGVSIHPPFRLAALQASCTAEVACEAVEVAPEDLLAGPEANVMANPAAAGTGGLETSALALGQALAALEGLETEGRADLDEPIEALRAAWNRSWNDLMATANALPGAPTPAAVRGQANALVLRMTQAYLTARKGSGFLLEEPTQRWARQALFFLVWSCPTPVAQAAVRDLAGLCSV